MLIELKGSQILFLDIELKRNILLDDIPGVSDLFCYSDYIIIKQNNDFKIYGLETKKTYIIPISVDNLIPCFGEKYFIINNNNNSISIFNDKFDILDTVVIKEQLIIGVKYSNNQRIEVYKDKIQKNKFNAIVDEMIINHPSDEIICGEKFILFFNKNSIALYSYEGHLIQNIKCENIDPSNIKIRGDFILISGEESILLVKDGKIYKIPGANRKLEITPYDVNIDKCIVMSSVSVILTCHPPYLKFLPECIKSIDTQKCNPKQKILVLDNIYEIPSFLKNRKDWNIKLGNWGNPNPARNVGLELCNTEWAVFFDADNLMPVDYIEKISKIINNIDKKIAFIYPNVKFDDKNNITPNITGYWGYRIANNVDTSSAWNVKALKSIGGWNENIHNEDDYSLVLSLTSKGWEGYCPEGLTLSHSSHIEEPGRWISNMGKIGDTLWLVRSIGILVDCSTGDIKDILKLDYPINSSLYLLNYKDIVEDILYNKFKNVIYSNKNLFDISDDLLFTVNLDYIKSLDSNILKTLSDLMLPVHVFSEYIGCISCNNPVEWNGALWHGYFVQKCKNIPMYDKNRFYTEILKNINGEKFDVKFH